MPSKSTKRRRAKRSGTRTSKSRPGKRAAVGSGPASEARLETGSSGLISPPSQPNVLCWEDDPESEGASPVAVPVPGDAASRFSLNIMGPAFAPDQYPVGTPPFRYWTARAALVRCRDFWERLLPADAIWQTGTDLPVSLDAGVQLNAYYHRAYGLTFYRDTEGGREIFVGESADIACHELGHAVLDALQPALWLAATFETAAFHEAFGDISALLTGLQVDSLCAYVLARHGGWIERDSRWTRVGEALGKALNRRDPDRASPLCLRNASNGLYYRNPAQLPASGPDFQLTREPHSLARTFVGGFIESLGGMIRAQASNPTVDDVQTTSVKAAVWLIAAIRAAPVQVDYFFQLASALVRQALVVGEENNRDIIASAFVRRGILPVDALDHAWPMQPKTLDRSATGPITVEPPVAGFGATGVSSISSGGIAVDAKRFGLKVDLLHLAGGEKEVRFPVSRSFMRGFHRSMLPPFAAAPADAAADVLTEPSGAVFEVSPPVQHEEEFIHYLFQRGRVEFAPETLILSSTGPMFARKTHRLTIEDGRPTLERLTFDCGFD